ncbi:hypothetical protein DFH08DRAFT_808467 [Mycena albidolilacea]|uniref:Uncharacterized protein n=1 Tax=Mycena albidolilacea TaxID=1033008 RepID=A0AAD7EQT0_9AGAR|nr:hypothetical protein DFH08DRAFT_808467 [Mycena albidolilacea]
MAEKTRYLCQPAYDPDPGHETRNIHDASPDGMYYAVVSQHWTGVVTSSKALARHLDKYPNAHTFSASTWKALMILWNQDCELNHEHKPWDSGDPASFSTMRKRPVSPVKSAARAVGFDTNAVASRFDSWIEGHERQAPASISTMRNRPVSLVKSSGEEDQLFYGISGHNRIFQSWEHAMVVLRETPGADLVFARDEAGIYAFIRAEATRMLRDSKDIYQGTSTGPIIREMIPINCPSLMLQAEAPHYQASPPTTNVLMFPLLLGFPPVSCPATQAALGAVLASSATSPTLFQLFVSGPPVVSGYFGRDVCKEHGALSSQQQTSAAHGQVETLCFEELQVSVDAEEWAAVLPALSHLWYLMITPRIPLSLDVIPLIRFRLTFFGSISTVEPPWLHLLASQDRLQKVVCTKFVCRGSEWLRPCQLPVLRSLKGRRGDLASWAFDHPSLNAMWFLGGLLQLMNIDKLTACTSRLRSLRISAPDFVSFVRANPTAISTLCHLVLDEDVTWSDFTLLSDQEGLGGSSLASTCGLIENNERLFPSSTPIARGCGLFSQVHVSTLLLPGAADLSLLCQ